VCRGINSGKPRAVEDWLLSIGSFSSSSSPPSRHGLYTILPLPILYGMCCNKGWSGGNTVLRNGVGDAERGWSAQTKQVFANNNIDSCTMASS